MHHTDKGKLTCVGILHHGVKIHMMAPMHMYANVQAEVIHDGGEDLEHHIHTHIRSEPLPNLM
jgi:hypothetical protein